MNHVHAEIQVSILINKKVGLAALRKGYYMALGHVAAQGPCSSSLLFIKIDYSS